MPAIILHSQRCSVYTVSRVRYGHWKRIRQVVGDKRTPKELERFALSFIVQLHAKAGQNSIGFSDFENIMQPLMRALYGILRLCFFHRCVAHWQVVS